MATINVDGKTYQVREGQNLLHACLSVGLDIPYFCWHPAMGSIGACRQCAVKLYKNPQDTKGKIVFACMTPVQDHQRLSIDDPEARAFRKAVAGWLMTNHPHDCPVCDEGGECHLQDMTVMSTHTYRTYRFTKRTFRNQRLGVFLHHEMNRCIQCFRCVRFYRELAGGRDLAALGLRNRTYFGRYQDGDLESPFAGNLVEVCPTGVFTDAGAKPHPARKWDLQTTPSICPHCCVGCNTLLGERYDRVRRVLNRYHPDINGYFLCDRGRFGIGYVHSEKRISVSSTNDPEQNTDRSVNIDEAQLLFNKICLDRSRLAAVGSPRASLEANYALRALAGADRFSNGMNPFESTQLKLYLDLLNRGMVYAPSLKDVTKADLILVLGDNLDQSAPMLAFAMRQAAHNSAIEKARSADIPEWDDTCIRLMQQSEKSNLIVASSSPTWLDPIASVCYRAAPDDIARLGFALAHEMDPSHPQVDGLAQDTSKLVTQLADTLRQAQRPLVATSTSCASGIIIQAAIGLASSFTHAGRKATLCLTPARANSLGAGLLSGLDLSSSLDLLESGRADTLIVLENDLYHQLGEIAAKRLLSKAKTVVVLDHLLHPTASGARLILATANPAESTGTFINYETRAQRYFQARQPHRDVLPAWRWIGQALSALGDLKAKNWSDLESIHAAMAAELPIMQPVSRAAVPASFRLLGKKIPRQSHRYSGRTAMHAHHDVSETKPPEDPQSALCFSMEGYPQTPPRHLLTRNWKPGWNSVQALFRKHASASDPQENQPNETHLIQPAIPQNKIPFIPPPEPFVPKQPLFLALTLHRLFGSEELSAYATMIIQRMPTQCLGMHPSDAAALSILPEQMVDIRAQDSTHWFPFQVHLESQLPQGLVTIPEGSFFTNQPTWIEIAAKNERGSPTK